MTPADVAADLGLSIYTVVARLRAGDIGGGFQVVPNGKWHVDADAYRAWKASRVAAHDADPYRIAPRSARSRAAQERRTA
jgi:hypothetical protein